MPKENPAAKNEIPLALLIGLASGLTSGLLGVGGGITMIPLLVAFYKMRQHEAHGTSLAVMVFTATAGAITYALHGEWHPVVAIELLAGSALGARLGATWVNRISGPQLKRLFGIFIILAGLRMLWPSVPRAALLSQESALVVELATAVMGLIVGILSGILGVGGGILMVPAMVFLLGLTQQSAQGVSLMVIVPTAIVGAYTHARHGNVVGRLVPWIAAASIASAIAGASLANALPAAQLKQLFGAFLLVIGGQMVISASKR